MRDKGGKLKIRLEPGPQEIAVIFKDNGPGMDEETLKNIFKPFFTTKEEGTGLGLPVSKSIVENHGGHMEVNSKMGEGATFKVILPAVTG